ncbi:serine-rich adhesin for platelets-like isoform X2 [Homalodisca vitripennis]|nr:serine-rich adhesin for platelets-like isoform X2 [Homalodisca vitripennis]
MTAINSGLHEVPGVRLPLQTGYASASPHAAVFMYSSSGAEGSVTLQLRDADDLDDKSGLASVLARLQQEDATLSISYQDTEMLTEGSIDVLLGTGPLHSSGNGANSTTFDLFESESGQDLTLSPQTFTSSTEAFLNDNSNSLGVPGADTDTVGSTEDVKGTPDSSKLSVKKARPKASSPNRQGPQQCQEIDRAQPGKVCGKVFGNASALAKHKLTHSDERKYVCTMCGKAFKRQDHLNGHMLTHRNKKPYECKAEGCGKSYCDARSLRRHTENHHSGSSVASSSTSPAPASPLAATCIQYAPPPPAAPPPAASGTAKTSSSQLQRLLATEPASSASAATSTTTTKSSSSAQSPNNDGLTKQQLDLIHQIMQQTQQQAAAHKQQSSATSSTSSNSNSSTSSSSSTSATPTSSTVSSTKTKTWTVQTSVCTTASKAVGPSNSITSSASSPHVSSASTTPALVRADPKPVECNLCHRKFKNVPALNGHMRLHGGYFKKESKHHHVTVSDPKHQQLTLSEPKHHQITMAEPKHRQITISLPQETKPTFSSSSVSDIEMLATEDMLNDDIEEVVEETDAKKCEKKESSGPPLQTASMSVRALIEEKIIQKRITTGLGAHTQTSLTYSIPAVPSMNNAAVDKNSSRRHSDSEHFLPPRTPPTQESGNPSNAPGQEKHSKTAVKRASSDPGSQQSHSPQLQLNFQNEPPYSLGVYSNDDGSSGYFSPSLQEDVFQQVQSVQDSMLLHGVDPAQLAESIQAAALQDIASLEDYQDSSQDQQFQHHQDLQSVLNSPLPVSLADFAYQSGSHKDYQSSDSTYAQSPLPSPSYTYPTPPASQEGQSPSFGPLQSVISGPASSPLSAAFYTSTMSSSAAVEAALNEVLPLGAIQQVYPSPPPQSPLSATPVPSPLSLPASSSSPIPHHTLQSQMMPNSDDPLLSSSPKDFASRKRFDFHTFKLLNNGTIDLGSSGTQDVTGIVLDRNGELKLFQTSCNFQPVKGTNLLNGTTTVYVNTRSKIEPDCGGKVMKTVVTGKGMQKTNLQRTNSARLLDHIKEEIMDDDVFLSPTSIPASPVRSGLPRKRPRLEVLQPHHPYQSRLRTSRIHHPAAPTLPYTPPPLLPPTRPGQGLYWQAVTTWPSSTTLKGELSVSDEGGQETSENAPECDISPHVNIGPQYQCTVPPLRGDHSRVDREPTYDHLLWDPGISRLTSDNEVDMYLEFACCAAVPGGGRNKEYALHLLHLCHGNIHEAMLKLMQPTPSLPIGHPLLSFAYTDSDRWSAEEMDAFHQGLNKYDKDFTSIAQEVGSKTVKQCVQFYYLWKKICPEDYKRLRLGRRRNRDSDFEFEFSKSDIPANDVELVSTSSDSRLFLCEYADCSASFNSRAALNGHIRIHGGGVCGRSPTPDKRPPAHTGLGHTDPTEEFPCKICGKVFNKVKSRSAHMKSHRPPDAEPKKPKVDSHLTDQTTVTRTLAVSSSLQRHP